MVNLPAVELSSAHAQVAAAGSADQSIERRLHFDGLSSTTHVFRIRNGRYWDLISHRRNSHTIGLLHKISKVSEAPGMSQVACSM